MNRAVVAGAWISVATLPLLLGALFLFGCCILPFHDALHAAVPLCDVAAELTRGEHHDHDDEGLPASPTHERQEQRRLNVEIPIAFRLAPNASGLNTVETSSATGYRSFISLGAIRCDRDVGLHLLDATFLI